MVKEGTVRFGPIRSVPPVAVQRVVGDGQLGWTAERLGSEGDFPNGGMWRLRQSGALGASVVVKRTGPQFLGGAGVWRGSTDPDHPQWWGREAVFYRSQLAARGWSSDARAAECYAIDGHDGVRDLWLEDVDGIPLPRTGYGRVVKALAGWQVHHQGIDEPWLSHGWIPAHLRRRSLDNTRTLQHPGWSKLFDLGFSQSVQDSVASRVTDPVVASEILAELPQLLTHYDFHHMNIGQSDGQAVIIDWATVGLGPAGHDVGFMLIDHGPELGPELPEVWNHLVDDYTAALHSAGSELTYAQVRRSVAISNVIRLGWTVDYLLSLIGRVADDRLAVLAAPTEYLVELQAKYLPER